MEVNAISGVLLIVLAGSCSGTFSVPFNHNKKWNWENNWFIWSFVALLIAPWLVACLTIPDLFSVYSTEWGSTCLVALFGLIWGLGAIMFGKGIHYLGLSLSLPIMQGLINSVGAIVPILLRDSRELLQPSGIKIMVGVGIMIIGIILFSIAGKKKEDPPQVTNIQSLSHFRKGLFICLLAGVLGPMINFAFVYGVPLQEKAVALGASPFYAANSVWSIALSAGFIMNGLECARLFRREKSWGQYKYNLNSGLLFAGFAGVIWYLSIMFYGMGGNMIGTMGASVGWAVMQSVAIITGNVAGILYGEWKNATKKAIYLMVLGLVALIIGVIIIA